MHVFYVDLGNNQGRLVAYHENEQNVAPSVYGPDVKYFILPDNTEVTRVGELVGTFDDRPIQLPTTPLADVKKTAILNVVYILSEASSVILSNYPQSEILSWPTKEAAARLHIDGGTLTETQTTLLNSELSLRGGTLDDLCHTIVTNAERFAHISGLLAGLRQNTTEKINAATTATAIDVILDSLRADVTAGLAST